MSRRVYSGQGHHAYRTGEKASILYVVRILIKEDGKERMHEDYCGKP